MSVQSQECLLLIVFEIQAHACKVRIILPVLVALANRQYGFRCTKFSILGVGEIIGNIIKLLLYSYREFPCAETIPWKVHYLGEKSGRSQEDCRNEGNSSSFKKYTFFLLHEDFSLREDMKPRI